MCAVESCVVFFSRGKLIDWFGGWSGRGICYAIGKMIVFVFSGNERVIFLIVLDYLRRYLMKRISEIDRIYNSICFDCFILYFYLNFVF